MSNSDLPQNASLKSEQSPGSQDCWHVVKPGENLTVIAQTYYGEEHASHWITLYNFNRERIGANPDMIQPGMKIRIPDITEFL